MANIKLVIEMPEEKFNTIKSDLYNTFPAEMKEWGLEAIRNGTSCETVNPCEDAISRQAALESIKNLYPDMPVIDYIGARRKWLEKYAPYFECEKVVEQLPSVTPKQRTGHWIVISPTDMYCSECNEIEHLDTSRRFCAYCGTRMIEPQEISREEIAALLARESEESDADSD